MPNRQGKFSKILRRLMIVGLAVLVLTPATPAWAFRGSHFRSGLGLGHRGGIGTKVSGFHSGFQRGSFRDSSSFEVQRHFRPRHRHFQHRTFKFHPSRVYKHRFRKRPHASLSKIWVRGKWFVSTDDGFTVETESSGRRPGLSPRSRENSPSAPKKVWVPGRWEKTTHGVLIWRHAHWTTAKPGLQ